MAAEVQLSLGICGVAARTVPARGHCRSAPTGRSSTDPLAVAFKGRLAVVGMSRKTQETYPYQIRQLVSTAHRLGWSKSGGLLELFADRSMLGRALTQDLSSTRGRLSKWTLAQRRSAVRCFARLMRPELRPHLQEEPLAIVDSALRSVAERIGSGYRLTGGMPRRRGGLVPTPEEVAEIIAEATQEPGFTGKRNRAFFTLLRETGSRVNALREVSADAVIIMPDGRLRLMLHAKGCISSREVEVTEETAALLREYVAAFEHEVIRRGGSDGIVLGEPGPLWRSSNGRAWPYAAVLETFGRACLRAGTPAYRLHAFRRAYATDAASMLPRHVIALAGGWQGLERLDNHYIRPREEVIVRKLARHEAIDRSAGEADRAGSTL